MKRMKQWMHWVLALVLLVMSLSVPAAAAETITVNVTNTPVQQQTSDDSGYLTFSKLGYGTYTIREIQAPYGYHPSTGEWQVTIDGTYQNPVQILTTVVNEDAPGWIRVIKTDALDGLSLIHI